MTMATNSLTKRQGRICDFEDRILKNHKLFKEEGNIIEILLLFCFENTWPWLWLLLLSRPFWSCLDWRIPAIKSVPSFLFVILTHNVSCPLETSRAVYQAGFCFFLWCFQRPRKCVCQPVSQLIRCETDLLCSPFPRESTYLCIFSRILATFKGSLKMERIYRQVGHGRFISIIPPGRKIDLPFFILSFY